MELFLSSLGSLRWPMGTIPVMACWILPEPGFSFLSVFRELAQLWNCG